MNKVISIIAIYTILLLSVTNLSADQKYRGKVNGHDNGYGRDYSQYGNGYENWEAFWSDNGNGYGNGYGKRRRFWTGNGYGNGYRKWKRFWTGNGHDIPDPPPGTNTPEPISSALFILGGAGLGLYRKFKNKG